MFKRIRYFDPNSLRSGQAVEVWSTIKIADSLFRSCQYCHALVRFVTPDEIGLILYLPQNQEDKDPAFEVVEKKISIESIRKGEINMRHIEWNDDEEMLGCEDEQENDEDDDRPVRYLKRKY